MSYRSIQQQVDQLFDRADHPNIAHKDDSDYKLMTKILKLPITNGQSIEIIKDVLEAIIYVSSHLIIYKPCQVFKQHVIKKHGRWGLCNIICYRDPNESIDFDPQHYYPMDYHEHPDEDSELSWSLGRMWYELLTDSRIPPIKALTQKQITSIIDTSGIKDIRITNLLKQILIIDKTKRIDLVTLIKHGLFEYEQKSKVYLQSVIPNLSEIQSMSKLNVNARFESKLKGANGNPYNPFEEELFKRDFKQAIVIADLFQKVKQFIFNHFEVPDNSNEIHFSCYLIDFTSYIRLQNFKMKREENQYLIVLLYDKLDYTKYLEKLLELEGKLQRKRKQKRFQVFRAQFPKLLQSPSSMSKQDQQNILYPHFKKVPVSQTQYLMSYAKCFKEQKRLDKNTKDYKNYVTLIEFMLIRSAMYVFSNARKYVFGDFIDQDEFELEKILKNIATCTDVAKLKRIQEKIIELYFSKRKVE